MVGSLIRACVYMFLWGGTFLDIFLEIRFYGFAQELLLN